MAEKVGAGIDIFIFKIVAAFIFALIVYMILRPALGIFGLILCSECDPLTNAFAMIVVPIVLAFAGIYKVVGVFQR